MIWQMMVACCTEMGSWGQRGMETLRKDVKNLLYSRRLLMMHSRLGRFSIGLLRKNLWCKKLYRPDVHPVNKQQCQSSEEIDTEEAPKRCAWCICVGAMENWGLVTYREVTLLVDPVQSSAAAKQTVALVVGHELAHQWFGNFVTMVCSSECSLLWLVVEPLGGYPWKNIQALQRLLVNF